MEISALLENEEVVKVNPSILQELNPEKIRIAVAPSHDADFLKAVEDSGLNVRTLKLGNKKYILAYRDLDFFDEPKKSRSEESGAIYLAERNAGGRSLLLQYLPPFTPTSRHFHKITTEHFHGLVGRCIIEGKSAILCQDTVIVTPFTAHQLRTYEDHSLALIEMIGNPAGLSMNDHFYV